MDQNEEIQEPQPLTSENGSEDRQSDTESASAGPQPKIVNVCEYEFETEIKNLLETCLHIAEAKDVLNKLLLQTVRQYIDTSAKIQPIIHMKLFADFYIKNRNVIVRGPQVFLQHMLSVVAKMPSASPPISLRLIETPLRHLPISTIIATARNGFERASSRTDVSDMRLFHPDTFFLYFYRAIHASVRQLDFPGETSLADLIVLQKEIDSLKSALDLGMTHTSYSVALAALEKAEGGNGSSSKSLVASSGKNGNNKNMASSYVKELLKQIESGEMTAMMKNLAIPYSKVTKLMDDKMIEELEKGMDSGVFQQQLSEIASQEGLVDTAITEMMKPGTVAEKLDRGQSCLLNHEKLNELLRAKGFDDEKIAELRKNTQDFVDKMKSFSIEDFLEKVVSGNADPSNFPSNMGLSPEELATVVQRPEPPVMRRDAARERAMKTIERRQKQQKSKPSSASSSSSSHKK